MIKKRIGEILLEQGLITKEKLEAALSEQTVTRERLGKILVRNGFIRQDYLIRLLQEQNPGALHDESVFFSRIPQTILLETQSMITAQVDDTIYLATLQPRNRVARILEPHLQGMSLVFSAVNPARLEEYLNKVELAVSIRQLTWERLLNDAMRVGASDIHIIPRSNSYTVMQRKDGVLGIVHEGTKDEYIAMISRIKDLSRMDMAERRRPQDGGFQMDHNGRVVSFRVVSVPTIDGERIVIRILDPDSTNLALEKLGITRLTNWRSAVARTDGLCLICGPTGSGKTTTLASTVREMNFLERAVYTVEDPVENRIPYAGQVNVNSTVGLDFSTAVRTFMRADPDVILVGEVRDIDTARNALKASETGHLVLATLHAGSIVTAVGRLRDIGVAPYELRHLLRGILVQRLVRVFCRSCGGKGCLLCGGSGYRGREVVTEVASFRDDVEVDGVLEGRITWPTILEDALLKVRLGRTDFKELSRVFGFNQAELKAEDAKHSDSLDVAMHQFHIEEKARAVAAAELAAKS